MVTRRPAPATRLTGLALAGALCAGGAVLGGALAAPPAEAAVSASQVAAQRAALAAIQAGHDAERTAKGLDALHRDARLDAVAQRWSDRMAERSDAGAGGAALVHSPTEPAYDYSRTMPAGWRGAAENIAYNSGSGPQMQQMWMASPGHRANIDNGAFDSAGYGISYDRAGRMWGTVVFGDYYAGPWAGTADPAPSSSPASSPASPPASPPADAAGVVATTVVSGEDRYRTGAALAGRVAAAPTTAVLVSGERLVDSVPAAPLARRLGAPLLLTTAGRLSPAVADLLAATPSLRSVVVVGGEASVSPRVVADLEALGVRVTRVAGADRYTTALAVAARPELASSATAYVARGSGSLADAVAVGGTAAALGAPVLLAPPRAADVSPALAAAVRGRTVVVVGGTASVPEQVATALGASQRLAGDDRYATAAAIADHAVTRGVATQRVLVASGDEPRLADALVSGAAGQVVLLVRPGGWGAATTAWMTGHGVREALVVGGATPTR
ncbi:cell wall-binding repeat-containing protein [Quadrisphaera sp. KR29]|uniref:cell wall-binding repeat-containing protein n=1 Tax=Quadrisphaera sp. KR29 TaxID=3461391 RepID=UPI004043D8D1